MIIRCVFRNSNEFHYCATCGRSIGVRLTPCKRCRKICFCSKACKVSGWNAFHRDECQLPNETITPSARPGLTSHRSFFLNVNSSF